MERLDLLASLQKDVSEAFKEIDGLYSIDEEKVHISEKLFRELFKIYTVSLEDSAYKFIESWHDGVRFIALLN